MKVTGSTPVGTTKFAPVAQLVAGNSLKHCSVPVRIRSGVPYIPKALAPFCYDGLEVLRVIDYEVTREVEALRGCQF